MRLILVFTLISISFLAKGQQTTDIRGVVQDSAGVGLAGVNVRLISKTDSLLTSTSNTGRFIFRNSKSSEFRLNASLLGYQVHDDYYKLDADDQLLIIMEPQKNVLDEVVVFELPVVIKEETIQYNAAVIKKDIVALLE